LLHELNTLMVDTYRIINQTVEEVLKNFNNLNLNINEMHMIEVIARPPASGKTISDIAQEMHLSLPSVTVAIKNLEKKGYVEKQKDAHDKRMVCVHITRLGRKANAVSRYFHREILLEVTRGMSQEEKNVLLASLQRLNSYFISLPAKYRARNKQQ